MSVLNHIRTTWSGVAGTPYYSSIFQEPTIGSSLQDCVDALVAFWQANDDNMVTALTWRVENEVTQIESTSGELVSVTTVTGATGNGSSSGDPLPRANQLLVQWSTNAVVAGRRRRGRLFMPGLVESLNVAPGVPSGALTAGVTTFAEQFIDACGGAFVIYSPTHRSFSPVTGANVWNQWAQLRSRRD